MERGARPVENAGEKVEAERPQGLEFNRATGRLWGMEMGQRGGDEVNLLRPGRNFGWPLYSLA